MILAKRKGGFEAAEMELECVKESCCKLDSI